MADYSRRGNESNFYIFSNTKKGKKYYFQARYYSATGKSSAWSNIIGVVAGDYNAPPSIGSTNVDTSSYRGTIEVDIKDSWKSAMPSDIKEIRWYAKPRPSTSPAQDWEPEWLDNPYKVLKPNETFSINDVMMVPLVFDIWAVPVDISGNIPEAISRCATGVRAVRPSQSRATSEIDGVGSFNPDNWFSLASLSLKLSTVVAGDGDGVKSIRYSVRVPGGEWSEWQETDDVSVLISILNQGITYVRWMTTDSLYDDMASDIFETYVKWDKTAPTAPGTPAKRVSSPSAITWEWAASTDSVSGIDHYEVVVYSGATLPGTSSGPFSVAGTSFTLNTRNDYGFQIKVRAVDKAGNASAYSSLSTAYYEDRIPPVISWAINGDSSPAVANENGWYDDASLVALITASDDPQNQYANESGVSSIFYSLDGGTSWASQSGASKSVALSEGVTHLSFYAVDGENNQSAKESVIIRYDKTAPTTASWVSSGCYAGDDRIFLKWSNGSDSVSGVSKTFIYRHTSNSSSSATLIATIPSSQTMYMDGARSNFVNDPTPLIPGQTYYYWVKQEDAAGNMSAFSSALTMDMQQTLASFFANFLDNGSFERGDSAPTSWSLGGASYVSAAGAHGVKYVTVTNSGILSYDYIFVQPSTTYCLSAYTKATGSPTVKLRVSYYDNTGAQIGSSVDVVSSVVGTSWTRVSASFSSPSSANLSHAKLEILSSSSTAIGVDAVQWEQGGAASPFCDTRTISADRLMAHIIKGDHISAGAVTADKIFTSALSAISADLGNVTAGTMDIGSGANSFHVNGSGDHWSGAALIGDAPFSVTKAGKMTAVGATLKTGSSGARVEVFPDANTGLIAYDDAGGVALKAVTGGADVGDVILGNFDGGQGAKWDKSAGTFTVLGSLAVNSVDVGATGFLKGGATGYGVGSGFWAGKDGDYHKFYIGDSSNYLKYSGVGLEASGSFTFKTGTSGYDNITDGSTYKKTTANEKSGAGYAYSGLDASGQIKKAIRSDVLESGAPPSGNLLYLSSSGLYMAQGGYIRVKILPDGTWRMAQNCDNAVGSSNAGIEWTGAALNVRGAINADDISAGTLSGRTIRTSSSGSRIEIFPDANTGFVAYDNAGTPAEIFKILVGGTDVGDVVIGNYAGGAGAKWDKSAGTFSVSGAITIASGSTGLDNLADGSTYKKTTANEKSGAGYAYTGLDSSGQIKKAIRSDVLESGAPPSANLLYLSSSGFYMAQGGYTRVKILPDGTWRMAQNCDNAVGSSNKGIEWTGSALNVRGAINAEDISAGAMTGRTVQTAASGTRIVMDGDNNKLDFYVGSDVYVTLDDTVYTDPVLGDFSGLRLSHERGIIYKSYTVSTLQYPFVISNAYDAEGDGCEHVQVSENEIIFSYKSNGCSWTAARRVSYGQSGVTFRPDGYVTGAGYVVVGNPDYGYLSRLTLGFPDLGAEYVSANFVITAGAQTIGGVKTLSDTSVFSSGLRAAASSYLSFGSTYGSSGYGIRDNAGTMEYKSSGGSWAAIGSGGGGTPGGSNTYVQFNDSSAFGGSSLFTFNKSTGVATATKFVATDDLQTGDKLILARTGGNVSIDALSPDIAVTITIPSLTGDSQFVLTSTSQSIDGAKTFSLTPIFSSGIRAAASSYASFGATYGSTGYGIRDNSGTMEYKNSGGSWAAIGSGGSSLPTVSRGALLYGNSSPAWATLSLGSSGSVLFSNGTDVVWASSLPAAGSTNQVQYRASTGFLAGDTGLVFDPSTDTLTTGIIANVNQKITNATAFDTAYNSSNTDAILLKTTGGSAGAGAVGASIGWTKIGDDYRKAAIAAVQTSSDSDQTGLNFYTHPSGSGSDPIVLSMQLDHAGFLGLLEQNSIPSTLSGMSRFFLGYDARPDSYTKLLVHCDGSSGSTSFTDLSSSGRSITSTATQSTSTKKIGTASAYFSGSTYMYCADSADWAFGTGNFTLDAWVYFSTLPSSGSAAAFFSQYADSSNYNWFYLLNNAATSTYDMRFQVKSSGSDTILVGGPIPSGWLSTGAWHHYAVVRSGNLISFYFDGKYVGTGYDTSSVPDIYANLYIGAQNTTTYRLSGYMDGMRVSKGVARWNGDFKPPSLSPYIVDQNGSSFVAETISPEYQDTFPVVQQYTPQSGTEVGRIGRITFDDEYLYIWTGNAIVGQIAISAFGS